MKLLPLYQHIVESRKTEVQGTNILTKKGVDNAESIISQFASGDESKSGKNVPIMAFIYSPQFSDIKTIVDILNEFNALEIKNRVKPVQIVKVKIGDKVERLLKIGDKQFDNPIQFSEYIHGQTNLHTEKPKEESSVDSDFEAEKETLWSGNGIDIYSGDGVGKCISYTMGGLTGKGYGFCIGQPGNTMYKSYRDSKVSSFYFIVDKNHFKQNDDGSVNLDDPLHIVVFDNTQHGVELTDATNSTGNIAEFGQDSHSYVKYLESKGVPVDKMVHNPKTPQEEEEERLLGSKNDDFNWFIKLPMKYKSAYIGRGHLLTNDQFDYVIGK